MGLITYEQIEDGYDASANVFNRRFGKIHDLLNGNIDQANIKNNSITRDKIAAGAVTSDKMEMTVYIDDNGWTVTDFGNVKQYSKTLSFIGGTVFGTKTNEPMPVGVSPSIVKYATITSLLPAGSTAQGIAYGFTNFTGTASTFDTWAASTDNKARQASSIIVVFSA